MQFTFPNKLLIVCAISASLFTSCDEKEDVKYDIPSTYTFERDGSSSVSFSGQTARLDMLAEIKAYLKTGDSGQQLDAAVLLNMFSNTGNPFSDEALNTSGKQIEDKTSAADVTFYKNLFEEAEAVSKTTVDASIGTGGQMLRVSSQAYINVNAKGWEFTQMVEKGLMGALIYNQIFNSYLTETKIGADVDNTVIVDGKNYTTMEHHWDEAFGYWGVPVDFPQGSPVLEESEDRFWAEYTESRDADLGVADKIMTAYITGRAAIVANDHETKMAQIDVIAEGLELVAAATGIHYINSALTDLNAQDQGNMFHHLSEGYGFINALKYIPNAQISATEINTILTVDFGTDGNFWEVDAESLASAKSTLTTAYPDLASIADTL
ncbi:DUF4856 domain-containing protein [Marinoscillum sp. MHG1-6]|uniref:DUF4856 domain-containing protein n=1 Tax=Marinoscillum sp. MHG1-6 TaxID=2959627 RepID=UPI0021582CB1|nr:DUF4856 domain-containing protein [Marinoscillum sp. MHG1-6]